MTLLVGNEPNQVPTNADLGTMAWADVANYSVLGSAASGTGSVTLLYDSPGLQTITPTNYGASVFLPDATTVGIGTPRFVINNPSPYSVAVRDYTNSLLGFIMPNTECNIGLSSRSSSSGVWTLSNALKFGASARLLGSTITAISSVIDLGSDQELILGVAATNLYAVVYNRLTNTFGAVTLVRTGTINHSGAILSGANQVLVVSCPSASTAFQAVTLSVVGTTITVNTAAPVTLSDDITNFADGCGLIAVGTAFVTSYGVAGPTLQIRALAVSGTTVTISAAATLSGVAGGLIVSGSSSVVIAVSTATTSIYTQPYTVSGASTPVLGTGTTTSSGTLALSKLTPLGTRWAIIYSDTNTGLRGGIISLSGTTTTLSTALLGTTSAHDAIVIDQNKLLVSTVDYSNILTNSAGTATVGTSIPTTGNLLAYSQGTTAYLLGNRVMFTLNCSGTSPVIINRVGFDGGYVQIGNTNSMLSPSENNLKGESFSISVKNPGGSLTASDVLSVDSGEVIAYSRSLDPVLLSTGVFYRGKSPSEKWLCGVAFPTIAKIECVQ